jgi:hypothetical protein
MFNPTSVAAAAFSDYLSNLYMEHFSGRKPEYAAFIGGAARLVLERLGNAIGRVIDTFTPTECANYFAAAGYDPY